MWWGRGGSSNNGGWSDIMGKVDMLRIQLCGEGEIQFLKKTSILFHKLKINTMGILIIPLSDDREWLPQKYGSIVISSASLCSS